jgi:hypothetical protein
MTSKSASASGSAVSSFAAPSDMDEPVTSGSKPHHIEGPMQQILIDTFDIPAHLTHREKVADLRVAYSKYLAIGEMVRNVTRMELDAKWTHKKPTLQDIVEVFMSRSGYFNRPKQFFPRVHHVPEMKKWLENEDEDLSDTDAWGDKKPSYKTLEEILDHHDPAGSRKKKENVTKGKKKQRVESQPHSEEEVVKEKGKGKAKAKKAREGTKKAGSSKSRHNN